MLPVAPQFFYQMAQNMGALSSGNECTQEQPAMKYDYYDNKKGVESNGVHIVAALRSVGLLSSCQQP